MIDKIIVCILFQKEILNIQPGRSDSGLRLHSETKPIKEIPTDVCLYREAAQFLNTNSWKLN